MAMNVPAAGGADDEPDITSSINTTPLVDVMLVLLIIFLITIPVVTQTIPLELPHERNIATHTNPQNIVIAVDADGDIFWNTTKLRDFGDLLTRIEAHANDDPQPEVHIRADKDASYQYVGRVVFTCQRGGIRKVAFITEPKHG